MDVTGLLFSVFLCLCGTGVVLSTCLHHRRVPLTLASVGSSAALLACLLSGQVLFARPGFEIGLWRLPLMGKLVLRMDTLSAFFVFVTGLIYLPVSLFSTGYLKRYAGLYSLKGFGVLYHFLFASIVLLLMAGDILSFLLAWEVVSIVSYLLVNYEHEHEENTRAGLLMLAMGEGGTLAAALGFLMLSRGATSLDFASVREAAIGIGEGAHWAIFFLTLFGFGVKAGLVPMSSWLPKAHPAAPGNVSALLSGVILNLGLYGIVRVNADLLPVTSMGQGLIVLVMGTISALIGILYATTRNDMKRMLAHSSIENMGIITAGIGAGLTFAALGERVLAGIALIAALYHMVNHSVYKSLLFLGAGAVDFSVGSRDMDRLGGLIRLMPWTSLFYLVGAISISAMPPFNGFVSEWLMLQTLLRSAAIESSQVKIIFALCGAGLALTAALAVTCFVKAFAMSFLGMSRSEEARRALEVERSMTLPMGFLAVICLLLGVLPTYVLPVLDRTVSPLIRQSVVEELVPPFYTAEEGNTKFSEAFFSEFHDLGAQVGQELLPGRGLVVLHAGGEKNPVVFAMSTFYTFVVLIVLLGVTFFAVRYLTRKRIINRRPAWDGGVRHLLPEMTYTATGFSNPVRVVFEAVFRPSTVEDTRETVAQHFRTAIMNGRVDVHIVDRYVSQPVLRATRWLAAWLGRMHAGSVNVYAAYVFMGLLVLLLAWLLTG